MIDASLSSSEDSGGTEPGLQITWYYANERTETGFLIVQSIIDFLNKMKIASGLFRGF